jgi:hypothetical protein
VLLLRPDKTDSGSGTGSGRVVAPGGADDDGPAIFADAKKLFDAGDIESAHAKIQQIPEGSIALQGSAVKDMENAWADWIFTKVEEAKTNDDKRALLKQIPPNTYVDKERREKALKMITELPGEPPPQQGGGFVPGPLPTSPGGAATPSTTTPDPSSSTSKTAKPAGSVSSAPVNPSGIDEAAIRRGLEGKVWSGKATVDEIRMLKAICSHMGDRACRDRASAMLKQKLEEQKK